MFALVAIATTAGAQTKYDIWVGGVQVTSANASNITGGDIKSGTVTFKQSTNGVYTLTLTNVKIERSGSGKQGIRNGLAGLIINFEHIKEIAGSDVILHSGNMVTMGKNSITRTRSAYKKYLLRFPPYSMVDIKPGSFAVGESSAADPLRESDNAPDQTSDVEYASALRDPGVRIPIGKGKDADRYPSQGCAG